MEHRYYKMGVSTRNDEYFEGIAGEKNQTVANGQPAHEVTMKRKELPGNFESKNPVNTRATPSLNIHPQNIN